MIYLCIAIAVLAAALVLYQCRRGQPAPHVVTDGATELLTTSNLLGSTTIDTWKAEPGTCSLWLMVYPPSDCPFPREPVPAYVFEVKSGWVRYKHTPVDDGRTDSMDRIEYFLERFRPGTAEEVQALS